MPPKKNRKPNQTKPKKKESTGSQKSKNSSETKVDNSNLPSAPKKSSELASEQPTGVGTAHSQGINQENIPLPNPNLLSSTSACPSRRNGSDDGEVKKPNAPENANNLENLKMDKLQNSRKSASDIDKNVLMNQNEYHEMRLPIRTVITRHYRRMPPGTILPNYSPTEQISHQRGTVSNRTRELYDSQVQSVNPEDRGSQDYQQQIGYRAPRMVHGGSTFQNTTPVFDYGLSSTLGYPPMTSNYGQVAFSDRASYHEQQVQNGNVQIMPENLNFQDSAPIPSHGPSSTLPVAVKSNEDQAAFFQKFTPVPDYGKSTALYPPPQQAMSTVSGSDETPFFHRANFHHQQIEDENSKMTLDGSVNRNFAPLPSYGLFSPLSNASRQPVATGNFRDAISEQRERFKHHQSKGKQEKLVEKSSISELFSSLPHYGQALNSGYPLSQPAVTNKFQPECYEEISSPQMENFFHEREKDAKMRDGSLTFQSVTSLPRVWPSVPSRSLPQGLASTANVNLIERQNPQQKSGPLWKSMTKEEYKKKVELIAHILKTSNTHAKKLMRMPQAVKKPRKDPERPGNFVPRATHPFREWTSGTTTHSTSAESTAYRPDPFQELKWMERQLSQQQNLESFQASRRPIPNKRMTSSHEQPPSEASQLTPIQVQRLLSFLAEREKN